MRIDKLHFTQTEVKTALKKLPPGKAKGPDGKGNLSLKRTAQSLSVSFSSLFSTQSQQLNV